MSKILILEGYSQRSAYPIYIADTKKQAQKWFKDNNYKKVEVLDGGDYYEREAEPSHASMYKIEELKNL